VTTKDEKLAALEAEFDSQENKWSGRMKFDDYQARRRVIESGPDDPPAPAPKAASTPRQVAVTPRFLERVLGGVAKNVREYVAEQVAGLVHVDRVAALAERVTELQARLDTLEKRKTAYHGVWCEAPYLPGDAVTHKGTLWYCHEATTDRPGTSDAWQLMVKHER
jgi:hypothetical protein